ncbi:MAG: HEAT repeat domain-containing protein [Myxococcota bacterium]
MDIWKLTTLGFACATVWVGWPEPSIEQRTVRDTERSLEVDLPLEPATYGDLETLRRGDVALARRLAFDSHRRVARAAIDVLMRAEDSETIAALITEDAPSWRSARAVAALGWIGDALSVRILTELLEEEDPSLVSENIAAALGRTGAGEALDPLRRLVERDAAERVFVGTATARLRTALRAIANIGTPAADRLLLEFAAREEMLGRVAIENLVELESAPVQNLLRDALAGDDTMRAVAAAGVLTDSPTALGPELRSCAQTQGDEAALACLRTLIHRGAVGFAADRLELRPDFLDQLYGLETTPAGVEVLERLSTSERFRTRLSALWMLAEASEDAQWKLARLSEEAAPAHRFRIGAQLIEAGSSAGIEIVVDALLATPNRRERAEALRTLAQGNEDAVNALRDLARSGDDSLASDARRALFQQPLDEADLSLLEDSLRGGDTSVLSSLQAGELTPRLERLLVEFLDDPSAERDAFAHLARGMPVADAIRLAGDDPMRQSILLRYTREDDPALLSLLRSHGESATDFGYFVGTIGSQSLRDRYLRDLLATGTSEQREVAIGRLGSGMPTPELADFARDANASVRISALNTLADRYSPEAAEAGLASLRDPDPAVRYAALNAVHTSPGPPARAAIVDAIDDDDGQVSLAATQLCLSELGRVDEVVARALDADQPLERRVAIALQIDLNNYEFDDATDAELLRLQSLEF